MHFNHEWTRRNTNQEAEQPYYFWFAQARIRPSVWWGNIGGKKVFGRPLNMAHETGTFPFQLQSQGLGRGGGQQHDWQHRQYDVDNPSPRRKIGNVNSGNNKLTLAGGQYIGQTPEHFYEKIAIFAGRFVSVMVIYGLPE